MATKRVKNSNNKTHKIKKLISTLTEEEKKIYLNKCRQI